MLPTAAVAERRVESSAAGHPETGHSGGPKIDLIPSHTAQLAQISACFRFLKLLEK